ncbi:hypothetical protein ACPJXG_09910 [Janthinobacterium sp. NFX145]|uniref:hypothetical protein n=1 Tax=Janthinobacterium sp. NFX145 TaxID=3415602 RepID=UPI003CC526D0
MPAIGVAAPAEHAIYRDHAAAAVDHHGGTVQAIELERATDVIAADEDIHPEVIPDRRPGSLGAIASSILNADTPS